MLSSQKDWGTSFRALDKYFQGWTLRSSVCKIEREEGRKKYKEGREERKKGRDCGLMIGEC